MLLNGWLVNVHCSLPVLPKRTHTRTHIHTYQPATPADKGANCVANLTVLNLRTIA